MKEHPSMCVKALGRMYESPRQRGLFIYSLPYRVTCLTSKKSLPYKVYCLLSNQTPALLGFLPLKELINGLCH